MYGMVNEGLREFVIKNHGEDAWLQVCADAGLEQSRFEAMLTYDDAVTYGLVDAVRKRLGVDAATALHAFGEYWPTYAQETAIGKLIAFGGDDFVSVLESLDDMHERVVAALPQLRPPSFEVDILSERTIRLHYYSERNGLAPMAIGLLHGLAAQYNVKLELRHIAEKSKGANHDIFEIDVFELQEKIESAA